jgi:hypothetical protein
MSYLTNVLNDVLEIIVSKFDYNSFVNLLSLTDVINILNLNYNHVLKLKYPEVVQKEKLNISSYINILTKYNEGVNIIQSINFFNEYKYVIYNSGYVHRLIKKIDQSKDNIQDMVESNYGIEEDDEDSNPKIIFIKDYDFYIGYRNKVSYINENITKEEKNILPSIKKLLNIDGGIICFKRGEAGIFEIEKVLQEMDYCACFGSAYEIKSFTTFSGLKVLYLNYDTESG